MTLSNTVPLSDNCDCCIRLFTFSLFSLISLFFMWPLTVHVVIIGAVKNNIWFNPALCCMTHTVTSAFSALKIEHGVINEEN